MTRPRTVPPVALVILWPSSVAEGPIVQLVRRLSEWQITATWAIEQPSQVAVLRSAGHKGQPIEVAALIVDASHPISAVEDSLTRFSAAGEEIAAISAQVELPRGSVERRLRQAGVNAIVGPTIRALSSTVTALPFGLWKFGPHISVPAPRRWFGLFGRASAGLSSLVNAAPALACIDLTHAGKTGSRLWQAIDQFVDQAAAVSARGTARIETISTIAAELADSITARPQRSILRMAA